MRSCHRSSVMYLVSLGYVASLRVLTTLWKLAGMDGFGDASGSNGWRLAGVARTMLP